jgi:hypothetical protein
VLYAFKSGATLTSFRTAKLDAWVHKELDAMEPPAIDTKSHNRDPAADQANFSIAAATAVGTRTPVNVRFGTMF